MYKQIIIARKDLNISPGKLAAQVSHGSIAFLSWFIRNNVDLDGHVDGILMKIFFIIGLRANLQNVFFKLRIKINY